MSAVTDPLEDALRDSRAWQVASASVDRLDRAASDSAACQSVRRTMRAIGALDSAQRVRVAGVFVFGMALGTLALREILPRYALTGLPWWWNAVAAVFGLAVAVGAPALAAAWPSSLASRLVRALLAR